MSASNQELNSLLFSNLGNVSGSYNNLNWRIKHNEQATNEDLQYVTYHESAHNFLNNSTAYGGILMGYANLHALNAVEDQRYLNKLDELIVRCSRTHEVYATWDGVAWFRKGYKDHSILQRLHIIEPYTTYFWAAEELLLDIPSSYLRGILFEALVRWCFQSIAIAERAISEFEDNWINKISYKEFPNARFDFIRKTFLSSDLKAITKEFIENQKLSTAYNFMMAEFSGDNTFPIPGGDVLDSFGEVLFDRVADYFEQYHPYNKMPVYRGNQHIDVFDSFFSEIYKKFPKEEYRHLVQLNKNPFDGLKTGLMSMETEELLFRDSPLKSIVIHPEHLTDELKISLLRIAKSGSLIIHNRHAGTLMNQYEFLFPNDRNFFVTNWEALVFIRHSILVDGEPLIVLIPFKNSDELITFTKNTLNNYTSIACFSLGSFFDINYAERWKYWEPIFQSTAYIVNDVSILYCLESYFDIFERKSDISYNSFSYEILGKKYTYLVFQIVNSDDTELFVITIASELLMKEVKYYINERYKNYVIDLELTENQSTKINIIIKSIVTEEYSWLLRSQFVIDSINTNNNV